MKVWRSSKFWVLGFATLLLATSCDKIEGPYMEPTTDDVDTTTTTTTNTTDTTINIRKVLIEDFTGHTCGNCPRAAETSTDLQQLFGEQVVVIAVHMGFFATPKSNPDSSYAYDFRTTVGSEIDVQFNIEGTGLPKGMVNRTEASGSLLLNYSAWGAATQALVTLEPDMHIDITNSYNSTTRTVTTEVISEFISTLDGTYNVVVVLTEDSIINWQKDYMLPAGQQDIPDYVHRHVLRESFNGTWGQEIATGSIGAGTAFTKTYDTTLPLEWDENHCTVVAYVYETTSNQVVQVEESKVK